MTEQKATIGFIGLGTMGEPMALNLQRGGTPLVVWNRTPTKSRILAEAGADVAQTVADVFTRTRIVFLMLGTQDAVDEVLARGTPAFDARVDGSIIVQMGTVSAADSLTLAREIEAAGGDYVEAPVSGSRGPAQAGQLLAMVAGRAEVIERVSPLLRSMCRDILPCGPIPQALALKLASNHFVYIMLAGLAETVHFARTQGVDPKLLTALLSTGLMSSDLVRMKLPKLIASDFSTQASLGTTAIGIDIVRMSARQSGAATPLCDACAVLCQDAADLGMQDDDVTCIIRAIEARVEGGAELAFEPACKLKG